MDLSIPKHCASGPIVPWQCHQFPESRFSLLFTPISLEPLRGRVETAGALGGPWHGWRAACTLRPCGCWCVLTVLVRAPRSAPDWCWACVPLCHAADQANPDAHRCAVKAGHGCPRRVIWTFGLSPSAGRYPLPSLLGCKALAHGSLCATVAWALLSSLPSPVPQLPSGWWVAWRGPGQVGQGAALGSCPCAWHGAGRSSCPSQPCL